VATEAAGERINLQVCHILFNYDIPWNPNRLEQRMGRIHRYLQTQDCLIFNFVATNTVEGRVLEKLLERLQEIRNALSDDGVFGVVSVRCCLRLDFYRARVVDGLGNVVHERLFVVELSQGSEPALREPTILGDFQPGMVPSPLPEVASASEAISFLQENALAPFLAEIKAERQDEVERIRRHVEVSLTELIARADLDVGRANEEKDRGVEGAAGRLAQAEQRHDELLRRRERRLEELERQKALSRQGVERIATALVLPHPERARPELRNLRPNPETEETAMRVAMEYERSGGRAVADVHEKDLGYDLTSLDTQSGELRLIEVKGLAANEGPIIITPNEHRVAEDRRDCYWPYVVTDCAADRPNLHAHRDPARFGWREVTQVAHYTLPAGALGRLGENASPSEPAG
jgi:Domain of unknown function (DUF3883)/Helicase conserved C-terminal domain